MAKRGRKEKPSALKRLAGNPGKRPLNDREMQPDTADARAPHGMSRGALKFWRKYAPGLIQLGVLKATDVPAFILMAELYAVGMRAAREVEEEGKLWTTGSVGNEVKRPSVQVLKEFASAFRLYAAEFGMTPSSRSGLHVAEDAKEPTLAEQLFGLVSEGGEGD
jgi:P27 family predicted phage terminase small subunit